MEYILLLLLFLLILVLQFWVRLLEKRQDKLRDRIIEIELNRSAELLKQKKEPEEKPKAEVKLTKEEREKQERMKTAFDNLMNYDERIARRIRK